MAGGGGRAALCRAAWGATPCRRTAVRHSTRSDCTTRRGCVWARGGGGGGGAGRGCRAGVPGRRGFSGLLGHEQFGCEAGRQQQQRRQQGWVLRDVQHARACACTVLACGTSNMQRVSCACVRCLPPASHPPAGSRRPGGPADTHTCKHTYRTLRQAESTCRSAEPAWHSVPCFG